MNPGNPNNLSCTVFLEEKNQRLDKFLTSKFPEYSRSRIQDWIEKACVFCDDEPTTSLSYKVKEGEHYTISSPPLEDATPKPQALDLDIVYEDEDLLVINKAPGMVVHPAPGHYDSTLVNALLAHCGDSLSGIGGVKRPGIVHRLDKDTSGLMVVAKNDSAHIALSAQFSIEEDQKPLSRTYWALVWGHPHPLVGRIETQIGRHPKNRQKMAVVREGSGKLAITNYTTKKVWGLGLKKELKISWVKFILETGRTHQIRVHSHHIGYPIIGDPLYGRKSLPSAKLCPEEILNFKRQALHAVKLKFIHPRTQKIMEFEAELPEDMKTVLSLLDKV
jgi:23S rRNA pseudouridine1911/1915/1917 synthase